MSDVIQLRPSEIERFLSCPVSYGYPAMRDTGERSPAAEEGTAIHGHIERILKGVSYTRSIAELPEKYWPRALPITKDAIYELLAISRWDHLVVEQRMSIYTPGASMRRIEITGTPDLGILRHRSGLVEVVDWKTGDRPVADPASNPQLSAYAALFGEYARVIGWTPEARNFKGTVVVVGASGELNATSGDIDVGGFYAQLKRASLLVDGPTTGKHCGFCPSIHVCPPHTKALIALGKRPESLSEFVTFTPDEAKTSFDRVALLRRTLVAAEKQLALYARENPIDLGDGTTFGTLNGQRRAVEPKTAYQVLEKIHGHETAVKAMSLSTSAAQIERALVESYPDLDHKALVKDAMQAIEASGGITMKTSSNVKIHKTKKPGAVEVEDE